MSLFSDRRYSVIVDDKPLFQGEGGSDHQLRVVFQIAVNFNAVQSVADIAIYNLAQNTINKLFAPNAVIKLSAGYVTSEDVIFSGLITNVLKERDGPSTLTRVIAISGSTARPTINHTMPTGSTVPQMIQVIAGVLNLGTDINPDGLEATYERKSLQGDALNVLRDLAAAHKFNAVVEQGKIVVVKEGKARKNPVTFKISQDNGMEGIPEITEVGCDVATRINPAIIMGALIDIQSELKTYNYSNMQYVTIDQNQGSGLYIVAKMDHSGDSWGDAWTTKITGWRASA